MALPLAAIMAEMNQPPAQARPGTVAPTDTLGAFNLAEQAALANFNAANQRWLGTWGGLAGIGGAGLIAAPKLWDMYNKSKAASLPSMAGPSTGALVYDSSGNPVGIAGAAPFDTSAADASLGGAMPYTADSGLFGASYAPGATITTDLGGLTGANTAALGSGFDAAAPSLMTGLDASLWPAAGAADTLGGLATTTDASALLPLLFGIG
jgi:hypothetical protein